LAALERYLYDPVHLDGDFGILPISRNRLSDDIDPELNGKIRGNAPEEGREVSTVGPTPRRNNQQADPIQRLTAQCCSA
jgi:hypothetical protein